MLETAKLELSSVNRQQAEVLVTLPRETGMPVIDCEFRKLENHHITAGFAGRCSESAGFSNCG